MSTGKKPELKLVNIKGCSHSRTGAEGVERPCFAQVRNCSNCCATHEQNQLGKVCTHTQGLTELLHSGSVPLKSTFQLQDYLLHYIYKSLYGVMGKQQKVIFNI